MANLCWFQYIRRRQWKQENLSAPKRNITIQARFQPSAWFQIQLKQSTYVYPDLGWNTWSCIIEARCIRLPFEEKMVYALVPVQEMLLKNEAVRMKALLTNIEPHIRYSSVSWHMLFLISAWLSTCRTSASL